MIVVTVPLTFVALGGASAADIDAEACFCLQHPSGQCGRDLLRPAPDRRAKGLLAFGGIDFDDEATQIAALEPGAGSEVAATGLATSQTESLRSRTEDAFRTGFGALQASGQEIEQIATLYRLARKDEPVTTLTGTAASETRLKSLERPPRVLHLATHGFYRAPEEPTDWPMLLAGITLAGANRALTGKAEDGILYAVEAQGLNLEGTELAVLSACETAQGQIDYGEGVYGLVRALRTAGAQNVLVTLRPVGDQAARDFMQRFYRHWLGQSRSDPALALQATQREYSSVAAGPRNSRASSSRPRSASTRRPSARRPGP